MLDDTLEHLRLDLRAERFERIDLASLIQTICAEFADVGYEVSYEGPARMAWNCRPSALMRAITNVIDNATKHGTSVSVALHTANDAVQIDVCDNGPGIPAEYQERIWQIFQTLAARDKVEGTGIGPYEGAHVHVETSGKVKVATGLTTQGQGHATTYAQIFAHDEFLQKFAAAVSSAAVGDPTRDVLYGPLINESYLTNFDKWLDMVQPHHTIHGSTGTGRITKTNPRNGFVGDPDIMDTWATSSVNSRGCGLVKRTRSMPSTAPTARSSFPKASRSPKDRP